MNSGIQLPSRKNGRQATRLPGGAPIDVRKMNFSAIENSPLYSYADDPAISHFFHMLSLLFPEGELFFMDSVRNYKKQITDPVLKQQVKAFMSQEALHTKAHVAYNKRLDKAGIDTERVDKVLHVAFKWLKRLPKKDQLAITLVCEHFTATIADELLNNEKIQGLIHESHKDMWLWHAIEETEHKAVAYDVYRAVGGSEARRLTGVPLTIIGIGPLAVGVLLYLMSRDGQLTNWRSWGRLGHAIFNRRWGLLSRTAKRLAGYRRIGFHPWHHENYELIEAWKARFAGNYAVV